MKCQPEPGKWYMAMTGPSNDRRETRVRVKHVDPNHRDYTKEIHPAALCGDEVRPDPPGEGGMWVRLTSFVREASE